MLLDDTAGLPAFLGVLLGGTLVCALAYAVLQAALERRLVVGYDVAPVARLRRLAWNAGLLAIFHALLFVAVGALATVATVALVGMLYAVNAGLLAFFGRVVGPGDFLSAREALVFAPAYLHGRRVAARLLAAAAVLALLAWGAFEVTDAIDLHDEYDGRRGILLVLAVLGIAFVAGRLRRWPVEHDAMTYSPTDHNVNVRRLGFVLHAVLVASMVARPVAPRRLREGVARLLERQERSASGPPLAERPDIIFLMMESLSDLRSFGVPLARDPLQFLGAARPGRATGRLRVKVIGGNTCDTEFEILTGIPVGEEGCRALPYMGRLRDRVYAVPRMLRRHGYRSVALHPFHRWFYNRDRVYKKLGFAAFHADEAFAHAPRQFERIADSAVMDAVVEELDDSRPRFVFGVSLMGHGPYPPDRHAEPRYVAPDFLAGHARQGAIDKYCAVIAETDRALRSLVERLDVRGRPYVLAIFGDHVPIFSSGHEGLAEWNAIFEAQGRAGEDLEQLYRTPLWLYSNVPALRDWSPGEMDAYDLAPRVLGKLGFRDRAAFGSLRAATLPYDDRAAYAFDTVHGDQVLTASLMDDSAAQEYDRERATYREYKASLERLNALELALRERRFGDFEMIHRAFVPDEPMAAHAATLWGAHQVDLGNVGGEVERSFDPLIASPDPFWGHYHRARLYRLRGDLAAVGRDAAAAYRAAPELAEVLVGLANDMNAARDTAAALAVLDPLVAQGIELPGAQATWAILHIARGRADAAVEVALERGASSMPAAWAAFHRLRLHALRGDAAGAERAAHALAAARAEIAGNAMLAEATMQFARSAFSSRESTRAVTTAVLEALRGVPAHAAEANLLWAALRLSDGDAGEAVAQALDAAAPSFWTDYHRTRLAAARGDAALLRASVARALEAAPSSLPTLMQLAETLEGEGHTERALAVLDALQAVRPDEAACALRAVGLRLDRGEQGEAVQAVLHRLAAGGEPWAWCLRARMHAQRGEWDRAAADAAAALRASPATLGSLIHLALSRATSAAPDGPIALLAALLEVDPLEPSVNLQWAALQVERDRDDPAIDLALQRALAGPDPYWTFYHRARLHAVRGDPAGVAREVAAALEAAPERVDPLRGLARGFDEAGRADAASAAVAAILRVRPRDPEVNLQWAALEVEAGRVGPEVERALGVAVGKPDPYWAYYWRVRMWGARGNLERIAEDVAAGAAAAPENAATITALGRSFAPEAR
jgi:phosphoglycerol transferase MdoB-like AlkP superfamily enzyme